MIEHRIEMYFSQVPTAILWDTDPNICRKTQYALKKYSGNLLSSLWWTYNSYCNYFDLLHQLDYLWSRTLSTLHIKTSWPCPYRLKVFEYVWRGFRQVFKCFTKFTGSYEQFAICISLVTSFYFKTHTSIPCFRAADTPHLAQTIFYDIF